MKAGCMEGDSSVLETNGKWVTVTKTRSVELKQGGRFLKRQSQ